MSEWDAWLGRTSEQSDVLTPALLRRFRATFDLPGDDAAAPDGIHWCLCLPDAATADLDGDGHPARGGFLPPVELPRRMWAASALTFHAPILAGDVIARRSTIARIEAKHGASGRLVFVDIDHATHAAGNLAVAERQTLVYREAAGPSAPDVQHTAVPSSGPGWDWQLNLTPDPRLLFRYSALTFNTHRIHYDQPYAAAVEGYAGLIVHGPLIATLLLGLAAQGLGPNRLASFAFRSVAPAIASEPLTLGMRSGDPLTLSARVGDGREVMTATVRLRDDRQV